MMWHFQTTADPLPLRVHIAIEAMKSMLTTGNLYPKGVIAKSSVNLADDLLKELFPEVVDGADERTYG